MQIQRLWRGYVVRRDCIFVTKESRKVATARALLSNTVGGWLTLSQRRELAASSKATTAKEAGRSTPDHATGSPRDEDFDYSTMPPDDGDELRKRAVSESSDEEDFVPAFDLRKSVEHLAMGPEEEKQQRTLQRQSSQRVVLPDSQIERFTMVCIQSESAASTA